MVVRTTALAAVKVLAVALATSVTALGIRSTYVIRIPKKIKELELEDFYGKPIVKCMIRRLQEHRKYGET